MQTLESQYGRDALVVDDLVPTAALRHMLGWTHVGTGDRVVLREVRDRIKRLGASDSRWTPALVKQTYAAALWIHAEHRAEYVWVMGPH